MLEINSLRRVYRGKNVLTDVNLSLNEGRVCLLLGPNGSGKTTLMKVIAGLTHPNVGTVLVNGIPVGTQTKAMVAYMPTEDCFYNYMRVSDAGRWYRDFYEDFSEERFTAALERMELSRKDTIRKMSSGMRAKLRLALTLSRDAKLILLDEPLNGVDILTRTQVISEIAACRASGHTLMLSSHLADELEPVTDDIALLKDGRLMGCGSKEEVLAGRTLTELYLQIYGTEGKTYA